jgi:hypothetical protein
MFRRRWCMLAVLLAILGTGTTLWWAFKYAERRRVQEALRELIAKVETESTEEPATEVGPDDAAPIELAVQIVMIDLSEATEALLAGSGVSELGSFYSFYSREEAGGLLRVLQQAEGVSIESRRQLLKGSDEPLVIAYGDGVPFSTTFDLRAKLQPKSVYLDVDVKRRVNVPAAPGKDSVINGGGGTKVAAVAQSGQMLIFGGAKMQSKARRVFTVPGLSRLPAVQSWFTFTSERDVQEAFVAFVTPRLVKAQ